jgi:beta-galactosidase
VNPLPWDALTIQAADYTWQLPQPEAVFLNIDHAQIGVGGDNSWKAIALPPYRLQANAYSYGYRVEPIRP